MYLDLFVGLGIYKDGSWFILMFIVDVVFKEKKLKDIVWLMFNDNVYIDDLEKNFVMYFLGNIFIFVLWFGDKIVGED